MEKMGLQAYKSARKVPTNEFIKQVRAKLASRFSETYDAHVCVVDVKGMVSIPGNSVNIVVFLLMRLGVVLYRHVIASQIEEAREMGKTSVGVVAVLADEKYYNVLEAGFWPIDDMEKYKPLKDLRQTGVAVGQINTDDCMDTDLGRERGRGEAHPMIPLPAAMPNVDDMTIPQNSASGVFSVRRLVDVMVEMATMICSTNRVVPFGTSIFDWCKDAVGAVTSAEEKAVLYLFILNTCVTAGQRDVFTQEYTRFIRLCAEEDPTYMSRLGLVYPRYASCANPQTLASTVALDIEKCHLFYQKTYYSTADGNIPISLPKYIALILKVAAYIFPSINDIGPGDSDTIDNNDDDYNNNNNSN